MESNLITSSAEVVHTRAGSNLEMRVVNKANQLLSMYTPSQKLFVNTSDLVYHISSMSVAITEAAFNIRIRGVDRRPVKTSQYINNIQACLNVLEKFIEIPDLDAENIYRGDLVQLDRLFDVFLSNANRDMRPKSNSLFSAVPPTFGDSIHHGGRESTLPPQPAVMTPVSEEASTIHDSPTKYSGRFLSANDFDDLRTRISVEKAGQNAKETNRIYRDVSRNEEEDFIRSRGGGEDILPDFMYDIKGPHSKELRQMIDEVVGGNDTNEALTEILQRESLNYKKKRSNLIHTNKENKETEDLDLKVKISGLKKRLNHEISSQERDTRVKQRRKQEQVKRVQQAAVSQMRHEKLKTKRLNSTLLAESKAREKMRKESLKDLITKLYRETLKAERERIRDEKLLINGLNDPEENAKRKKERIGAIENYFNDRINLIRDIRAREAAEREAIEYSQILESKKLFQEQIKENDSRLAIATQKMRQESDEWLNKVKEVDPAVILHRNMNTVSMDKILKKEVRTKRNQKNIKNIATAYLPEYAKRFT